MSHLGSQISALVDGQLSPSSAERLLAHVAACDPCADELAAARAARRTLASATDVPVDPRLTARLLALGACEPQGPARDRLPSGSVPMPGSRRAQLPASSSGCLKGDLVRSRTPVRVLAAAAGVGVVTVSLVALGVQPQVAPSTHPAHALTLLSRASTAQPTALPRPTSTGPAATTAALAWREPSAEGGPDGEPVLEWLTEEGWSAPSHLPDGYTVAAVREDVDGSTGLELDLAGPDGTVVVTEQHGRLDPAAVAGAPVADVGGRQVHLLSDAPWHAVWQSGSTVVSVVAQTRTPAVEDLVTAYPHRAYDDRVAARLARGWGVVAGAWGP
ncbi:zf-HC2 domain-containing protein [Actinotalea ferrariae]|uniref:zf-HC2 domain-containing protein n=1 Tax=Actinotalea ferrariae TaxID=1386098 RepID=UPI001C8C3AA6|nr:zf-HC2 domain-containing protein [Actinotalea ferrariae]MBX9244364.1 zf-HC2 domain-containing protein [Actinotalea ferrariae]